MKDNKTGTSNTGSRNSGRTAAAVIGAGIVGTCCAAELIDRGYEVSIFDRGEPGREGASRSNAGQIIPSRIEPMAYPGIVRDAPGMLLDRHGPLWISPTYLPRLTPWLWRFVLASRRQRYEGGVEQLAELNTGTHEATRDLYQRAGLSSLLRPTGALHLYESPAALARARSQWRVRGAHGYAHEFIEPRRLRQLEPDLADVFAGAVFEENVSHVSDPLRIVEGIHRYATRKGMVFHRAEAHIISRDAAGITVETDGGKRATFDYLVIAAGAWSRRLLNQIGDDAPLEAERGYNVTIPRPNVDIRHCLIFADRGFVATPLDPGLRIGGWIELAGLRTPPVHARIRRIIEVAKKLIPGLDETAGELWMGHRPAVPDSLPVIRRSRVDPRIVYAFGHGHLGLTQAPVTARRVVALLASA